MAVFRGFVPSILALLVIAIGAIALALAPTMLAASPKSPLPAQQKTQPLDPLTAEEIAQAAQIASSDRRVKAALGPGRQRLIQVEFLALKPTQAKATEDADYLQIGRHAAVLFYRYQSDEGVHVVVDLQKKAVVSVSRIEGRAVPLGADEIVEAFNLASKNERVRSLLGSRLSEYRVANLAEGQRPETRVEGLRILTTSRRDPCYRHRCIHLLFHNPEGYLAGTTVMVDLTAQTVRAERTIQ